MDYNFKIVNDIINAIDHVLGGETALGADEDGYFEQAEAIEHECERCGIPVWVATGASKAVIIPTKLDFVIKIPFFGAYEEVWHEEDDDYELEFTDFTNANLNLHSEDIKNASRWDYCENEIFRYDYAMKAGIKDFFADEEYIITLNSIRYYIQEKAVTLMDARLKGLSIPSNESQKFYENYKDNGFYSEWCCNAIDYYGKELFVRFLAFVDKENLSDFHNENYGYVNDRPVLIDWAGFRN